MLNEKQNNEVDMTRGPDRSETKFKVNFDVRKGGKYTNENELLRDDGLIIFKKGLRLIGQYDQAP